MAAGPKMLEKADFVLLSVTLRLTLMDTILGSSLCSQKLHTTKHHHQPYWGPRLPTNVPVASCTPGTHSQQCQGPILPTSMPAETVHGGTLWPARSGNNHTFQHTGSSQAHHNKKMHADAIGSAPEASDSGGWKGVCCWIP